MANRNPVCAHGDCKSVNTHDENGKAFPTNNTPTADAFKQTGANPRGVEKAMLYQQGQFGPGK